MIVIPAIDIRDGRCIRLVEGDYDREVAFDSDPVSAALRWQDMGAQLIHVVDLDGAKDGGRPNADIVRRVIASTDVDVQVSGGIRSLNDATDMLDAGAVRVVFGTILVEQPNVVRDAVAKHGVERIAVAIDSRDGIVRTRGWRTDSSIDAIDLARRATNECGITTIMSTDTARDGTLTGPNLAQIQRMTHAVDADIIAAGGVANIDDLLRLRDTGVAGAITGMAIYTGDIDLAHAITEVAATVR